MKKPASKLRKCDRKNSAWLGALVVTLVTGAFLISGCGNNATVSDPAVSTPANSTQPAGTTSGNGGGSNGSQGSNGNGGSGNSDTNGPAPMAATHPIDTAQKNYHGTAVFFQNQTVGFVGGDGFILRTTDGGKTWSQPWVGPFTMTQFTFPTPTIGFSVGIKTGVNPPLYAIYNTQDGGQTWRMSSEFGEAPGPLHFTSAQVGFIGNRMTTDGAKTWKTLPIPSNAVDSSAYFDDAQNGYAVTQDNNGFQIQRTTDGGKTWTTTLSKSGPITRGDIASTSPEDAWVLLDGGSGMTQTSYSLFHTQDGGHNWTPVVVNPTAGGGPAPGFPNEFNGQKGPEPAPGPLDAVDSQTAYMVGVCRACNGLGANSIGSTHDGGKTWTNNTAKWPGQDADVSFVGKDHSWVLANANGYGSVLYETQDGGKTWRQEFVFGKSGPVGD